MNTDTATQPTRQTQTYEMSYHQRDIESCFEESNYEQGISLLDQLRDPRVRPRPAHIRQLIYLALWPLAASSSSGKLKGLDKGKEKEVDPFSIRMKSPSKTKRSNKDRRPEDEFVPPSSEAIERSWRLLHAYSLTYPPELLLRAIPCYPLRDSEVASVPREIDAGVPWQISTGEDMDSILSKVAVILMEQKDCWGLLRPGVVAPPKDDSSPAQKRQPVPPLSSDEEDELSVPALIGTHSWPLLEWLIKLFEKDQELVDVTRSDRFSVFLLSQIKPPSSNHELRSNVDTVLNIIFFCYEQSDERHQDLGRRLMGLLIDLTSSPNFLPIQLIISTTTHLTQLPEDIVTLFLRDLSPSDRGVAFKTTVCDRYLSALDGRVRADLRGAARPQARKARLLQGHAHDAASPLTLSGSTYGGSGLSRTSYPWSLPGTTHVLEAIEAASRKESRASYIHLLVLYELIAAFSLFKASEREKTGESDSEWKRALQGDHLRRSVLSAFSTDGLEEVEGRKVTVLKDVLNCTLEDEKNRYC